ncbi:MAG: hypothetical protein LBC74_03125 [Planctomycetaceae bacterium]|jgi:hypothetical protein|nr:hypothetical protein [Planctomycetaceae bacterium]
MNNTNSPNESSALNNNTLPDNTTQNIAGKREWSYSGKAMRAQFILYLIVSLLAIGGVGYSHVAGLIYDNLLMYVWLGIVVLLTLLWLHFYVTYFYRVWTIKYKLEGNCLYCYKGFFTQKCDTLELMYICDLQLVRTLFDIILNGGVGKLIIFSSIDKTDSKLVISGIDNPHHILELIEKTRTKLREQRAIISGNNN